MGIRKRRPRNASLRFQSFLINDDITKKTPEKKLVFGLKKTGGRNAYGRITLRARGGGATRRYRVVDFKRDMLDVPGKLVAVEYDPNRNVRIGLIFYKNGAKRYILLPKDLKIGDQIVSAEKADANIGNCLPLRSIPVGYLVHNIEMRPGCGGILVRSAGTSAQIMGKTDNHVTLRMPSKEIRMVPLGCKATIGELGNADYQHISWGKAGRSRHRGFRPLTRGMAKNPIDHPHGGGEGRSKSGSHPRSPWGWGCKGQKTRHCRKKNTLIIKRRSKK